MILRARAYEPACLCLPVRVLARLCVLCVCACGQFMELREMAVARNALPPDTRVPCLTFLRHPVQRAVSLFYFLWMKKVGRLPCPLK